VLDDEMFDHKVKRIVVTPGKRLSYQFHAKRAEHWFIVSGQATVILDGVEHDLGAGDRASTSRSARRTAARTTARCRSSSSRSSTARTSARTTSCVSRTTSDGRPSSVRIDELLAAGPTRSFEFFPPKSDEESATLAASLEDIKPLRRRSSR
jgi:hypothetical protein